MSCSPFKYAVAVVAAVLTLAPAALADVRDPVGETASYEVVQSSSRTSSMIQGGSMDTAITSFDRAHPDGPMYDLEIDWTLRLRLLGTKRGSRGVEVPEVYFTPEFMRDLRVNGEYAGPTFRVRHLGFADVRNADGASYANCDKILIYDIEESANEALIDVARNFLVFEDGVAASDDIEDLEITAHIKEGVPVLGAVRIDITGKYQGQRVKAGADYETP